MKRVNISSGGPWEAKIGYSRAVRVGPFVHVSGSTSMTPSGLIGKGDPYVQTVQALRTIEAALKEAGATLADVVRTRLYLANIEHWQEVGRAHGDVFSTIRPATTMVEVSKLIDPEMLVEMEAEAIVPEGETVADVRASSVAESKARDGRTL